MKPTVICLTPIKDEAWILERFLSCASVWADVIIVADQNSSDDSAEIVRRFPKVRLIHNSGGSYDEAFRQRLLLGEARKIDGPKLLLALDADEFFTADGLESAEWDAMLKAAPGTVMHFDWIQVAPGFDYGWEQTLTPVGFMDDGSGHSGRKLHSARIPIPECAPQLRLEGIKLLHYHYVDWGRMRSKVRWYQCWERIHKTDGRPLELFRRYHPMLTAKKNRIPLEAGWLEGYEKQGIDMRSVRFTGSYPWDSQIAVMFREHGTRAFARLHIWDYSWELLQSNGDDFQDPRSWFEKLVNIYLIKSQPRRDHRVIRKLDHILVTRLGW